MYGAQSAVARKRRSASSHPCLSLWRSPPLLELQPVKMGSHAVPGTGEYVARRADAWLSQCLGQLRGLGAISMSGAHMAAMRGLAGEPACERNYLDYQRDAGACDGDNQQDTHGG